MTVENPNEHVVPLLRHLSGPQRDEVGKILQHESVTEYRYRELSRGKDVHSVQTLSKAKSDYHLRDRLSVNVMEDVELEMENEDPPYIRRLSKNPFHMMMWLDEAMSVFANLIPSSGGVLHLDATGSIFRDIPGTVHYYALVFSADIGRRDGVTFPLAEFVTTKHEVPTLSYFLDCWWRVARTRRGMRIKCIVVDCSFALIHACVRVFNDCGLPTYLHTCYDYLQRNAVPPLPIPVAICCSHSMQIFAKAPSLKLHPGKQLILSFVGLLLNCPSMKLLDEIVLHLVTVLFSRSGAVAQTSLRFLMNTLEDSTFHPTWSESEEVSDNAILLHESNDTLRRSSPFYAHFMDLTVLVRSVPDDAQSPTNVCYCPTFGTDLLTQYLPLAPLFFPLLVGQRKSNAVVESFFGNVKHYVLDGLVSPAFFVRAMLPSIKGRLRDCSQQLALTRDRETRLKRKMPSDECSVATCESEWGKRAKKQPPRYLDGKNALVNVKARPKLLKKLQNQLPEIAETCRDYDGGSVTKP